ncbi:MAG: glycosyltransferase family 2 protein, partial [Candidatus Eremiobacteraeota bacterium]|nr:glycosyltransferase family 2 protein [Candidatus Eremiobacteraeota bacterium]
MKIVSLTRVKIDGDVIEEFVRHTARYVDELVIVDNTSPDATRRTILDLQAEGLPITLLEDDFIEMRLDTIESYARQVFARSSPDYLLPLDADEFLRAQSREILEARLTALPSPGYAKVCWVTYVPTKNEDRSEERILARMRYHLGREIWPTEKVFL